MIKQIQHVFPIREEHMHDTRGEDCICCPTWYSEEKTVLCHNELSKAIVRPYKVEEDWASLNGCTGLYIETLEKLANAFIGSIGLIDEDGLCEVEHCCEWTLAKDRKRLNLILDKYPIDHFRDDTKLV